MYYPWDETFTYEIHTQPYRTTDIQLEPGEQVLEMPFLSEEKVWEIGAGVSRKNDQDVQHFFVKPSFSALTTNMIIITDRRVYHLLLKSFKDRWMVMVQWEYPGVMPYTIKTEAMNRRASELTGDGLLINPEFLSFDYKMTYSLFKKPLWLPKRVYDDGRKTYIELDEKMLHTEAPVIFNHRNERINYRVRKNLAVIDELIEKVTVRRGREKVTITKKNYRPPEPARDSPPEGGGKGDAE
jgi:type IV secretion system protein VirB9